MPDKTNSRRGSDSPVAGPSNPKAAADLARELTGPGKPWSEPNPKRSE